MNEREEMMEDSASKAAKAKAAAAEACRLLPMARSFLVVMVTADGNMAISISTPGYADAIAIAQEGGMVMQKHLAAMQQKSTEEI